MKKKKNQASENEVSKTKITSKEIVDAIIEKSIISNFINPVKGPLNMPDGCVHSVSVSVPKDCEENLMKFHNIDVAAHVNSAMLHETALVVYRDFIKKIDEIFALDQRSQYTLWDHAKNFFYKIRNKIYEKKIEISGINQLLTEIHKLGNDITNQTGEWPELWVITNTQVASLIQSSSRYVFASANRLSEPGMPYLCGNISGVKIFVDPYIGWDNNTVYIGPYVNKRDRGIHFIIDEDRAYMYQTGGINATIKNNLSVNYMYTKNLASNLYRKITLNINKQKYHEF